MAEAFGLLSVGSFVRNYTAALRRRRPPIAASRHTASDNSDQNGHIAVVVAGTGRVQTVRVLPLGDEQTHARHFTLFHVIVTPLR
jgi:hypothetical protein